MNITNKTTLSQQPQFSHFSICDKTETHQDPYNCNVAFFDCKVEGVVPPWVDVFEVNAVGQENAAHVGQVALGSEMKGSLTGRSFLIYGP